MNIIEKYNQRAKKINSLLCVGLDADFEKLPEKFKKLPNPQFEFNKWIIEETYEYVAAYNANSAFYEARGDQGTAELKMTMNYLIKNHPDIFTILCRTSNPGAPEFQDLSVKHSMLNKNVPLWEIVAEKVSKDWNKNKNCMLVVGATYPEEMRKIRSLAGNMTFLVPGIGAQGGDLESSVKNGLNSQKMGMIINSARGIIFAENPKQEAKKLCEEIREYRK